MLPGCPSIRGLLHAIPRGDVAIEVIFTGAHVNDVQARRRKRERSDRSNLFLVEDRVPDGATVRRLPHASAIRTEIINTGISWDACDGIHLSAAERSDHSPFHLR